MLQPSLKCDSEDKKNPSHAAAFVFHSGAEFNKPVRVLVDWGLGGGISCEHETSTNKTDTGKQTWVEFQQMARSNTKHCNSSPAGH